LRRCFDCVIPVFTFTIASLLGATERFGAPADAGLLLRWAGAAVLLFGGQAHSAASSALGNLLNRAQLPGLAAYLVSGSPAGERYPPLR